MAPGTRLWGSFVFVTVLTVGGQAFAGAPASTRAGARAVSPEGAVYTFGSGPSGEAVLTIDTADLHVEKSVAADGRSALILRAGDDEVRIEVTQERVTVSGRDAQASLVPSGADEKGEQAVRVALARSRPVQLFRSFAAQVGARAGKAPFDQAVALSGAFIGQVAGDPGALRNFAGRHRSATGGVRPASTRRIIDCWGQYEQYISWAWDQYAYCLTDSGRRLFFSSVTWCEMQYYMRAESAWFQFLSCSTIPVV